ncbi:MAG TPA: DUF3141 domain-containing protein [Acetobacteraceae bacterium]|nr:DUF3141 domain-containing protein [Acetobacteraceae bacterium]
MVPFPFVSDYFEYTVDAMQRGVLMLDVLRQRGNNHRAHEARKVPHVLRFDGDLVMDGRELDRPVNYGLVRIVPPEGVTTDPAKRPFVVFDPRAGHGPGIGGMKHDSEIGVILAAGHPCYFVGFAPEPMPGQTVADVCRAEALFIEEVARRHPKAEGKPCLIGNCQAGWQIMLTAAIRPDLPGPIMLAGSPLSYWAGVRGRNPLRYLGGLLGGTWLTALSGDLGHGIFDGANLVANFERMNPANTYWSKLYNVYSKIDTEPPRFLEFERWWSSPVLLNAVEMQTIADELFVGDKLAIGELRTEDGVRIDLRNIRSPIIVFCSWGDDITPPQQALGWIPDLYEHERDIVAAGQTIVYTLHESIGHLGIFVSGKVATKEHEELAQCMDLIDVAPPGLYEAVITEAGADIENPELVKGRYLFSLEARTLDDIRRLGGNSAEDERSFAAAARVSEINLGLYNAFLAPFVRMMTTEQSAEAMRRLHPNRLRFDLFADVNPLMQPLAAWAEMVRENRMPARADNPWLAAEHAVSDGIVTALQTWTQFRDLTQESLFFATYGAPLLQALVGLGTEPAAPRRIERDLAREAAASHAEAELSRRIETGGLTEAVVRAAIYVNRPWEHMDERNLTVAGSMEAAKSLGLSRLKEIGREQFLMVRLDEERAVAAIPALLPADKAQRAEALGIVRRLAGARGAVPPDRRRRLARIEAMFNATPTEPDRATA